MCLADTCTAFHPQHKWRNGFDDHKIILLFALHTEAASHATSAMVYEATAVKEKTPQTGNYSGLRPAVTFENESWPSLHVQTWRIQTWRVALCVKFNTRLKVCRWSRHLRALCYWISWQFWKGKFAKLCKVHS